MVGRRRENHEGPEAIGVPDQRSFQIQATPAGRRSHGLETRTTVEAVSTRRSALWVSSVEQYLEMHGEFQRRSGMGRTCRPSGKIIFTPYRTPARSGLESSSPEIGGIAHRRDVYAGIPRRLDWKPERPAGPAGPAGR